MTRLKRAGLVALAIALIAAVGFALGPRVTADAGRMGAIDPPPEALAALDGWLAEREARFDDLTPETEKTIVWANPAAPARTPLSVVYLHGFSATRQELSPVPEDIAAALGANLFLTRLRGHGRPGAALGEALPHHWMEDTLEAMAIGERIGEKVILIGCSTGGTLAIWLTHWLADPARRTIVRAQPEALVLLAPNLGVADPRAGIFTLPWGVGITEWVVGDTYSWEPANPLQAKFWTTAHPPAALASVQALVEHVVALPAEHPDLPTLAIWTSRDQVVDPAQIAAWLDARPTRQRLVLTDDVERGNHVLAGRIMAPSRTARVVGAAVDFVRGLQPQPGR